MVTRADRATSIGGARARAGGGGAAGYALVVVIMAVTVLNIMLAAAMPKWSEMIKRDKEEELISRGFQYAEAIRVFQKRYGRLPTRLDELVKAKPRSIRQLYKDPMTEDGQWELIFQGQGSPVHVPGLDPNLPPGLPAVRPVTPGVGLDPNLPKIQAGPIVGVRSRSTDKSLLLFFGHDSYDEWEFRVEMITGGGRARFGGASVPSSGTAMALSTRWLGRPMPNLVPPGNGLAPNALQPPGPTRGGGAGGSLTPPPPGAGKPFG